MTLASLGTTLWSVARGWQRAWGKERTDTQVWQELAEIANTRISEMKK